MTANRVVRAARASDAAEVVRLRELMFTAMGLDLERTLPDGSPWRVTCADVFRVSLGRPGFAAFVVDAPPPGSGLAACGMAWVSERLPGPGSDGRIGYIGNMSTDPRHRRQGHARAVLQALMGWLADGGVRRAQLTATDEGRGLYESFGFAPRQWPAMDWVAH